MSDALFTKTVSFIDDSYGIQINVALKIKDSFKELIFRGANTWTDAPPEIKELVDLVKHGRILQDYHSQDTSKKK